VSDELNLKSSLKESGSHSNLTNRLLIASIGAWAVGKYVNTKLKGSREEIRTIAEALMASKKFKEELDNPSATVESVVKKLREKEMTASTFERIFGIQWPL